MPLGACGVIAFLVRVAPDLSGYNEPFSYATERNLRMLRKKGIRKIPSGSAWHEKKNVKIDNILTMFEKKREEKKSA